MSDADTNAYPSPAAGEGVGSGRVPTAGRGPKIRGLGTSREVPATPLAARRSLSIALVRPAAVLCSAATQEGYELPPIGLAYLAAALTKAGHRVRIIDAFGEAPAQVNSHADGYTIKGLTAEQLVERIPHDVDLIGLTCMFSSSWIYCRHVIGQIASVFRNVPIIVGGEHPTADHERLLRRVPEVLCCVLGEGEETVVDIAAHLTHGLALDEVPGIARRGAHGEVVANPDRRRIQAVDEIPWPDWRSVPLATYLDRGLSHDAYTSRTMPMVASRGCPYQCTFCSSPQMFGTKWTARDPRKVIEEMRHYHDVYGARYFEFHDLTMILRKDWITEFSRILIEEGPRIQWTVPAGTRSEVLDGEVLALMKRSGCRSFSYAPESGSPEELKRIKKRVDLRDMLASMRQAASLGLVTRCHLIIGLPDQTKKDVLLSLAFATRVAWAGAHDLGCWAFAPYPGSELYQRLVAEGRIDPAADNYDQILAQNVYTNYQSRHSWTPHLPAWSISWLCLAMTAYFYALQFTLRPLRLASLLRDLIGNRKRTYLEGYLLRKLRRGDARPVLDGTSAAPTSKKQFATS